MPTQFHLRTLSLQLLVRSRAPSSTPSTVCTRPSEKLIVGIVPSPASIFTRMRPTEKNLQQLLFSYNLQFETSTAAQYK